MRLFWIFWWFFWNFWSFQWDLGIFAEGYFEMFSLEFWPLFLDFFNVFLEFSVFFPLKFGGFWVKLQGFSCNSGEFSLKF